MFFISILKFIQGYLLVHLTGYAPERFLNMCSRRNILIWNLRSDKEGYIFCISVKAYKSLRPILKKTRTRAKIIERHGLPFFLFRYKGRKMFAIGIAFFAVMLFYTSRFVWNIEINGNSYLSDEIILEFLEKEDADFGTKISSIDCAKLEEILRSTYSEVIWTSIKIYGTKMTIDIQESLLSEKTYEEKKEEICDIIAAKDGIITYMITRHGRPMTKVGTEVKKGDCLVSAEIPINSDYGDVIDYLYERADADVKAQVSYVYEEYISQNYHDKISVGQPIEYYMIQIGDIIINNPFVEKMDCLYEESVENMQLRLGKYFYFPIFLKKVTCKAYELVEKEYSKEDVKMLAEEHFAQYLHNLEEKGIQIIEKNVMIKKVNQNYLVSGIIIAEESIVDYRLTEIRRIENMKGQIEDEFN